MRPAKEVICFLSGARVYLVTLSSSLHSRACACHLVLCSDTVTVIAQRRGKTGMVCARHMCTLCTLCDVNALGGLLKWSVYSC